ncbi:MAG TPA: AAA family ATPase [Candidatus Limnocylindrales bacterium]|nr:AAA family ATPase [Candidatus Limnocylindrales bacterium]
MRRPSRPHIRPFADDVGLQIRVLGPLEIRVDGMPLVVDTRKALAIVALLAVERRPFGRDELAALLWEESDDESARGALRRTLSVLRGALGDRWLRVDRSTVTLDDAARLDLAALEAATASDDPAALRAAAALARGPFLAGFSLRDSTGFDDWRATRASAVERTVEDGLDRLAAAEEADGNVAEALAAAAQRVGLDPLDEPAQRRLMALLARTGDRAGAIRQYRACVAVLERELGVAPLAETTELYESIRNARPESAPAPPSPIPVARSRLPIAGRDPDLAAILGVHGRATPDGGVVLVTGEAGIGKTRLAEAVAEAVADAGGRVLAARAFATESSIAYGPIVDLVRAGLASPNGAAALRSLPTLTIAELGRLGALPEALADGRLPEVGPAGGSDGPAARVRLLEAIAATLTVLAGGRVPGLVVVEDLQWADEASREALLYLGRRLTGRALLLLLAWRSEDLDDLGLAFAAAAEAIPAASVRELGRLDRPAVRRLAAAAAAAGGPTVDADGLLEASEGLPLYVVEALAAGIPGGDGTATTIRALLRERLAAVSETAAQVLAAAAVIGRSFDLPLVRGASGRSEEETITALEELVRRGLVREVVSGRGAGFDFAHARLREAAYEATSLARRRMLHRRTADLLRADPERRADPRWLVQLAGHELAAGREAEAAEAFLQAGLRSRALYANREAAVQLETALALGHPDVAGIQQALGEIRTAEGNYAGAIAALEAAAAVAEEPALPGIELRLGRVHARRGDLAAAASHLDAAVDALRLASRPGDARLLARALVERAVVAQRAGELDAAGEAASLALTVADTAGDVAGAGSAHRILGLVARDRGDLAAARAELRQSLASADDDPDTAAGIAARNALALVEAAAGNHEGAIDLLRVALDGCRRIGERHLEAAIRNNLADQLHALEREEEAMDHLKRAVTLFAEVGGAPGELEPEIWKLIAW